MWIINCLLLIIGTAAGVCGISFFIRNQKAAGRMRFYIFAYGVCSAIWCIFFGLIGFCEDLSLCYAFRKIADIGVVSFLIAETFLVTDICGVNEKIARSCKALSIVLGAVDYAFFSQDKVNTFIRMGSCTTWLANPEGAFNRAVHSAYIALTFIMLFSFAIVWYRNNKVMRLRRFLRFVFISNFTLLFFTLPDTFLPALGKPAVATSGIGAALCAIVMWYGATQLGSFDIRMGNLRDRLFDFIEAGVIVLDTDKQIVLMNRYAENRLQSSQSHGNAIWDYTDISEEDARAYLDASMNEIVTVKLRNASRTKAYSVRLSAIKDSYGEVFCFLCVFVDVTEEVEAVSKYEIASRAKSRFLAQMSHEIRTPINAVLGMNEMILRESADPEILEYAGNIDSAGNTLLSIINSILDFSKIEDGKMEIVPVKYNTASFINDLYHSIAQRAEAKGLAFHLELDETMPCALIGDDVRVSQVIMNLLTNAVKYTEKGSVTLSMRVTDRSAGRVQLTVAVRDTGIGIRDEDKERLFESFERLDEVRNHNIEGTGLGISIVTSLLGMMGSRLQLESTYGKGSVFSFVIEQEVFDDTPIGDYEKRLKDSSSRRDQDHVIHAPNARILVVDDNDMNLKVARNLLKLCGIKPKEASSGEETIEMMKRNAFDIVFLDHMMPGMDGIETLHRLREQQLLPENTVVIALTANAVVGAREAYLAEGFTDYLSKPVEIRHLVEKLRMYLPDAAYTGDDDPAASTEAANNGVMEFAPEEELRVMEFGPEEDCTPSAQAEYDLDCLKASGIDVGAGLSYCAGDEAFYFEMLNDFTASCEGKLQEIHRRYRDENWRDYEAAVHALKSNAKMIGSASVYELAKSMEEAAERKDAGYIHAHHEGLIQAAVHLADAVLKNAKRDEQQKGQRY